MIDRTSDPLSPLNSFGSIVEDLKIVLAQTSGIVDANELDVHLLSPESKRISKYARSFIKFGEKRCIAYELNNFYGKQHLDLVPGHVLLVRLAVVQGKGLYHGTSGSEYIRRLANNLRKNRSSIILD